MTNLELESRVKELEALVNARTQELNRSLSLIQVTLDSIADGVLVADKSGKAARFNEGLLRMWNVSTPPTGGRGIKRMLTHVLRQLKNPAEFLEKIRTTVQHEDLDNSGLLEFTDGRLFEYQSRPQRMGAEIIGRVWSFHDVTTRKQAEEALRNSERHYRLLFENNPTPVFVYGQETLRFIAVNEAAVLHYGYTREEFLSLTLMDISLPEEVEVFLRKMSALSPGAGNSGIWRHRKKDGKLIEMEMTSHSLLLGDRRAWLSLAMDVTQRLSLEAQLRQSQKMDSVGQLAGGIAHDFNNLLTVISGHSGILLAMKNLNPGVAEPVKEIFEAARRAAELTRQLLTFSRKQVAQLQVVDLNEVVTNVSKLLRRILGEDISLEVDLAPSPATIKADLGMIEQILMNLAVNSRDAMPKGGKLRLSTGFVTVTESQAHHNPEASAGRFVCVEFSDTGCGIAAEHLPRIFEPFFTTKEIERGTGLGLATVYGIVKQHQGWIEVASQLREGTTFRIFLPASNQRSGPLPVISNEQRIVGGGETILVVEDEAPLLKLIQHILESHGYKVLGCSNGKSALEAWALLGKKIDLLLTDMILPDGMAGSELAQTLQASKPGLRVVYTSGYDTEKLGKDMNLKEGFNFVQKPFHARKLAETVYDCLNARNDA
ncbi:MAG TPA: ATP-binding protein [Verrucomicrobiae bacterium]|jgi:PAS domain S-box-containing protein